MPAVYSPVTTGSPVLYVTQRYPDVNIEAIEVTGSIVAAWTMSIPLEEMDMDVSIQSGEINTILIEYSQELSDEMDLDVAIQAGVIEELLVDYDQELGDEMDFDVSIQSGELDNLLVTVDLNDEALEMTGTILTGTLS